MKKIDEYKLRSKKCKKISIILGISSIIFIALMATLKTWLIIIGIMGIIILAGISGKYYKEHEELENKIEYMKIHEEIIEDTKN